MGWKAAACNYSRLGGLSHKRVIKDGNVMRTYRYPSSRYTIIRINHYLVSPFFEKFDFNQIYWFVWFAEYKFNHLILCRWIINCKIEITVIVIHRKFLRPSRESERGSAYVGCHSTTDRNRPTTLQWVHRDLRAAIRLHPRWYILPMRSIIISKISISS